MFKVYTHFWVMSQSIYRVKTVLIRSYSKAVWEEDTVPLELEGAKLPKVAVQHLLTPRVRYILYKIIVHTFFYFSNVVIKCLILMNYFVKTSSSRFFSRYTRGHYLVISVAISLSFSKL